MWNQVRNNRSSMNFDFLEYENLSAKEIQYRCPSDPQLQCDKTFSASDSDDNILSIFQHVYERHSIDWSDIKTDYTKWYLEKNMQHRPQIPVNVQSDDVITANDVEELAASINLLTTKTTTVIPPGRNDHLVKANEYYKLSNEVTTKINQAIADYAESQINNNQLKQKLKTFHNEFLQKVSKM
ncbi:hypothetical protein I4U23_017437 [Adineta vaga]|nr:hypothetical protein I4U23_017437 [Adineta vaga]